MMRQGSKVILVGALIGVLGALAASRALSGLLFGVSATSSATYVLGTPALCVAGLFACWYPRGARYQSIPCEPCGASSPAPHRRRNSGSALATGMKACVSLVVVVGATGAVAAGPRAQGRPDHAISQLYNRSLGVGCDHCHSGNDFTDASKPTFDFARRMERMVRGLNNGPLGGVGGISCWSCHRGLPLPARVPRANWESIATAHETDFIGGRDGLGLAMGVYAASLGVDCSHCHVGRNWTDASKPAHQMVEVMSTIFELIPTYFDGTVRMPRTQCYMCHQGHIRVERALP